MVSMEIKARVQEGVHGLQVALFVVLSAMVAAVLATMLPRLVGQESFVVLGGSMEPAIRAGDLVVVFPTAADDLRVGDVITFRTVLRHEPVIATHRLVNVEREAGRATGFQTKGDANAVLDPETLEPSAVLGRVDVVVPLLGHLIVFTRQPTGQLLLVGVPGVLLLLGSLPIGRATGPRPILASTSLRARRRAEAGSAQPMGS